MRLKHAITALLLMPSAALAQNPPVLDFNTIIREETNSADCAITFDDGPGAHTGKLLDILRDKQVKATFFLLGAHAKKYPDMVRRIVAEGHEVENHSWDHPDMRKLDEAARNKEMDDTDAVLRDLGASPRYFRPPYGSYDDNLVESARKRGMEVVLWNHDSVDWRYHSVAKLEVDILPKGKAAHGVFLFHDIHDSTIAAMPALLDELKSRGCQFATVAQWVADTEQRQDNIARTEPPPPAKDDGPDPAKAVKKAEDIPFLSGWIRKVW